MLIYFNYYYKSIMLLLVYNAIVIDIIMFFGLRFFIPEDP